MIADVIDRLQKKSHQKSHTARRPEGNPEGNAVYGFAIAL